jgi:outer membrane protein assembly factor BamB
MKLFIFVSLILTAQAENWPSFRGPGATGNGDGQHAPSVWNAETESNLAWKTAIPGLGHSSPVVWGDKVFITTAISKNPIFRAGAYGDGEPANDNGVQSYVVLCLDRKTGKVLWEKTARQSTPQIQRHPKNTHASPTPATDGKHVLAYFGSEGLYSFDMDGKLLWKKDLGALDAGAFDVSEYQWGIASSPILYKNLAILQCDIQKDSFIAAFDADTGKEVWRTSRKNIPSWATPTVYEGKGRAELITNGAEHMRGYDPLTGKELWNLKGTSMISVPTPFVVDDIIYLFSGYSRFQKATYALKPGSTGDLTPDSPSLAWHRTDAPYLPTPIVYAGYVYTINTRGEFFCYRAKTGEEVYKQRLGTGAVFSASPIAADGRIYLASEDGDVYVVKPGPTFELLGTNRVGEVIMATPAIANGTFIVRTPSHVFAFATSNKK